MASRRPYQQNMRMSLHERFTYLRNADKRAATTTSDRLTDQLELSKNKRLALQFERRQNLFAAMKKKVQPRSLAIRERLSLPRGFIARRRGAGRVGYISWKSPLLRGLRKPQSDVVGMDITDVGPDISNVRSRISRSPFSSRRGSRQRSISRNRSLPRARSSSRSRSLTNSFNFTSRRSRSPFTQRYRGRGMPYFRRGRGGGFRGKRGQYSGSIRESQNFREVDDRRNRSTSRSVRRGRGRGRGNIRGRGRGGDRYRGRGRGRGGYRGRGRGRGRGGGGSMNNRLLGIRNKGPIPTKEELDQELDQYMASNKSGFEKDRDNDAFMAADDVEKWD